jgi:hypothetical protein
MEVDPLYSDWLTVVDTDEFDLLSKLDYWERVDDGCLRRVEADKVHIVLTEQEWRRLEEVRARIEVECTALDAAISADQATVEMDRLLAIEPKPKVVAKVETPAEAEYRRLYIDPPNHPPSNRPPNGSRDRFESFGRW